MKSLHVMLLLLGMTVLFVGACGGESALDTLEDVGLADVGLADVGSGEEHAHQAHSEVVPVYVEMAKADLAELYSRDVYSDDQLSASVRLSLDGPQLDVRGLRFRGSTTRLYPKKGFNIRLEERPELDEFPGFNFRSEARSAGNRIILNALWTDPSGMREALTFGMYKTLGLPASQFFYTDLYINDIFEGLYLGLERVDREALRGWKLHRTEGEFTMVRDQSKSNRHLAEIKDRSIFGFDIDSILNSDEERIALLQEVFDYRGEPEDINWTGLLELIRWSHKTSAGAQWEREFAERFDVEHFIDFLAIHVLTHDRDSLDIDFWLYRDESESAADPRWKFLPWDKNLTFGTHYFGGFRGDNSFFDYDMSFVETMGNALVIKTLQTPALRTRLHTRLAELMRDTFDVSYFRAKIDELQPIVRPSIERQPDKTAFVVHPAQHQGPYGLFDAHVDNLLDFVELRYQYIQRQIEPVNGAPYQASYVIEDGKKGDVVFLTDAKGWTIARLELSEDVAHAQVTARVEPKDNLDGIDRIWTFEVDGAPLKGALSVYYRNTPLENWYTELEAIGRQPELVMTLANGDGTPLERLETRVNPLSNRVEATVELVGTTTFLVVH